MRRPRHAYCQLLIFLCFAQVSALKVDDDSSFVHARSFERHAHTTLQPANLNAGKGGSEVSNAEAFSAASAVASDSVSHRLQTSSRLGKSGQMSNSTIALFSMLFFWVVIAVCLLAGPGGGQDPSAPRSPRPDEEKLRHSSKAAPPASNSAPQPGARLGSFARRYHNAKGQEKQALELLLRCNVIPHEEFYSDNTSHEHIEECIWVAKVMLLQKPLEVWVGLGYEQGQISFKDTVAAINSARENARMNGEEVPEPVKPQRAQSPDSPDAAQFSPGSLHKDASAVSLGSSVSFGAEEPGRDAGAASPSVDQLEASAPPTQLSPAAAPQTAASMPPQPYMAEKSPVPILNCYTQVEDNAPPSSNENMGSLLPSASSLGNDGGGFNTVLSPSPSAGLPQASQEVRSPMPQDARPNIFTEAKEAKARAQVMNPTASLGSAVVNPPGTMLGAGINPTSSLGSALGNMPSTMLGAGFNPTSSLGSAMVNPPNPFDTRPMPERSPRAGVSPTSSLTSAMINPPSSQTGAASPPKRFSFVPQEVMAPKPDQLSGEQPRPPSSATSTSVSLRPLADDQVRRIVSRTDPDLSKSSM